MLHYPRPNRKARQGVWQSHLNNVPAGDIELDIPEVSASLSKFAMNNREISNAIRSASTLAKDQSSKLSQAHLDLMLRVWRDSNPTWPTDEDLMSIIIDSRFIVVVIVLCIGILVAFGISSRGYQVLKNKDVMIFYR